MSHGLRSGNLVLFLSAFSFSMGIVGCATYTLPANHLETPEARGTAGIGRLELLGISMGSDLVTPATLSYPPPESTEAPTPVVQRAVNAGVGFVAGASEKIDLGIRIQPYSPLALRFKYQVAGEPETTAKQGNFSAAFSLSPGILFGSNGDQSTSFFSVDGAFLAGYRFKDRHLISLSPFFTVAGVSGLTETAAQISGGSTASASSGAAASVSANQFGAGLGYQYTIEGLILRSELSYVLSGSVGDSKISGIFAGGLLGFAL